MHRCNTCTDATFGRLQGGVPQAARRRAARLLALPDEGRRPRALPAARRAGPQHDADQDAARARRVRRRGPGQGAGRPARHVGPPDEADRREPPAARLPRAPRGRAGPSRQAGRPDPGRPRRRRADRHGPPDQPRGLHGHALPRAALRAVRRSGLSPPQGPRMTARLRHHFVTEDHRRWWTFAAMCSALFKIRLDNTVVNVALPSIQKDPGSSISGLEWTVNAYTLSFTVLLVTAGRLGDIFGRRKMFLFGVVAFGLSSAFIGFSQSSAWLVAGRAAQGIGAAFMMPATLSIISNAFPPQERGKAIGTWAGVSAMALAIGPVVGGFLVENVSWQSIFFLNVPVAIVAVFVTL